MPVTTHQGAPRMRRRFVPKALPLTVALLALVGAVATGGLLAGSLRYPLPYSDVWHYLGPSLDRLTLQELLLPHNQHIVVTTKLALWLDRVLDDGRLYLVWGINLALVGATLALLGLAALRQGTREGWTDAAILGLALAGYSAALIAGFPFFLCHLALMFLVLAAALLTRPEALARASRQGQTLRLLGAIAIMLLAQLSLASGAAVGLAPALLLLLLAPRPLSRRGALAVAAALGAVTLLAWAGLYLLQAAPQPQAASFGAILLYGLRVLGSPLAFLSWPDETLATATWGGCASLLLLLAATIRVLRRPEILRAPLPWCAAALLLACGASMAGVALVRAGTVWGPLDPKYLHYALVMLGAAVVLLRAGSNAPWTPLGRTLRSLAVLLLPVLNLGGFLSYVPLQAAGLRGLASQVPGLQLIVADPRLTAGFDHAIYQARLQALRDRRLAFEAPGAPRILGATLRDLASREITGCHGALFEALRFPTLDPARQGEQALRVTAAALGPWQGASLLVFTAAGDSAGRVLGYALLVTPQDPAEEGLVGGNWSGYLAGDPTLVGIEAHLVDPDGDWRCLALTFPFPAP